MTKLGIIGAMDVEVQVLKEQMENLVITEKAGTQYYSGTLNGLAVVLVKCGIGKVNAAIGAQILCDCFDVTTPALPVLSVPIWISVIWSFPAMYGTTILTVTISATLCVKFPECLKVLPPTKL